MTFGSIWRSTSGWTVMFIFSVTVTRGAVDYVWDFEGESTTFVNLSDHWAEAT